MTQPTPDDAPAPKESSPASQTASDAEPSWRVSLRNAKIAVYWAAGAFAAILLIVGAGSYLHLQLLMPAMVVALSFFVLSGVALIRCLITLGRMGRSHKSVGINDALVAAGLGAMSAFGMFIAFMALMAMARGRQLRSRGKILLPPLIPKGGWSGLTLKADVPEQLRSALAARWRENGRTEHASVAAFARLTMDLMALGAPSDLIRSANLDAQDEIRHTELCFSLAKALDGRDVGPGPFPEAQEARTLPKFRSVALAKLAVDSLIDGALHEGLSARILSQLQTRCEVPEIRALVRELAIDESRHSAHGWDVVAWCLAEGGAPVAQALRGAAVMLPETVEPDLPAAARGGAWEAYGIHREALETAQYRRARESIQLRVDAMTARPGRIETPILAVA